MPRKPRGDPSHLQGTAIAVRINQVLPCLTCCERRAAERSLEEVVSVFVAALHGELPKQDGRPEKIRVSIGWPKRAASCGAIGECWSSTEASSDRHAELFISLQLTDAPRIVDVLAHELDHATVGTETGHGKAFKRCALAIGLVGPMRTTTAGPEFSAWAEALFKRIGPYPAGYLTDRPKQGTRMLKCECPTCGYIARVSQKWLSFAGPPICPIDLSPVGDSGHGGEGRCGSGCFARCGCA